MPFLPFGLEPQPDTEDDHSLGPHFLNKDRDLSKRVNDKINQRHNDKDQRDRASQKG